MKDLSFMPGFIHLLPGLFSQEFVSWIGFVGGVHLEHVYIYFSWWPGVQQHHLDHQFFCTMSWCFKGVWSRLCMYSWVHVQCCTWLPPFYLFFFEGLLAFCELTYIPLEKLEKMVTWTCNQCVTLPSWERSHILFPKKHFVLSRCFSFFQRWDMWSFLGGFHQADFLRFRGGCDTPKSTTRGVSKLGAEVQVQRHWDFFRFFWCKKKVYV